VHSYRFPVCLSLTALLIAGCGGGGEAPPELGEVTGVITVDGKPASGLYVTFEPEGTRASTGETNDEGRYVLYFNQDNPGAAVGSHVVRITQLADAERKPEDEINIPSNYNVDSGLRADVKAGENSFDFSLETNPAAG